MNDNFSYVEEVIINDALNKDRILALSENYRITCSDCMRAVAFINITQYKTREDLKKALMEFKKYHKEKGTKYNTFE